MQLGRSFPDKCPEAKWREKNPGDKDLADKAQCFRSTRQISHCGRIETAFFQVFFSRQLPCDQLSGKLLCSSVSYLPRDNPSHFTADRQISAPHWHYGGIAWLSYVKLSHSWPQSWECRIFWHNFNFGVFFVSRKKVSSTKAKRGGDKERQAPDRAPTPQMSFFIFFSLFKILSDLNQVVYNHRSDKM